MKATSRIFASLFFLVILLANCTTVKQYVESGDYDGAIDRCVSKLRGKQKKQTEYVQGLELAFKKAQERDLAAVNQLLLEDRDENWARIHDIHLGIRMRQNKIQPLTPLKSSKGYMARFDFVDIGRMEQKSRENAAEFLYNSALSLIEAGEKGDKMAARSAYRKLQELSRKYYKDYRASRELLAQARELGTSYVLLQLKNESYKILPIGLEERLLSMSKNELDDDWRAFYFNSKSRTEFDYKAVFRIRDIDVSPERVSERSYLDEKEIKDGWEYVLDAKGNVMKDTCGNDIKRDKYVRINATVLEVHQTKAARLSGSVEIIDLARNHSLDVEDMATEILFEHHAATFRGDRRALSNESLQRIGSSPVPFPNDSDMLAQAADKLKPSVVYELRNNRAIF